jgi:hypothetical protein
LKLQKWAPAEQRANAQTALCGLIRPNGRYFKAKDRVENYLAGEVKGFCC